MEQNQHNEIIQPDSSHPAQQDVQRMVEKHSTPLFFPVLVAILFHITIFYLPEAHFSILHIITHAALILFLVQYCIRQHLHWQAASVIGFLCGAIVACIAALYQLIISFTLLGIFSLITNTAFTGIIDGIATGFLFIIASWCLQYKNKWQTKKIPE